jgi:proteasome lid subunit RPN8/RPN11
MSLAILPPELTRISDHGRRAYPNECCGVLLGKEVNGWKLVMEAKPLENAREDSPQNRFLITADDFRASEQYAREQKLEILGFYHSHPDHPAQPSDYDREHAWPWFSYVIVSVQQGEAGDITSWELAEDRSVMHQEVLEMAFRTVEEVEKHAR